MGDAANAAFLLSWLQLSLPPRLKSPSWNRTIQITEAFVSRGWVVMPEFDEVKGHVTDRKGSPISRNKPIIIPAFCYVHDNTNEENTKVY